MNAYSESTYLGDVLKCEAPNLYSRDTATVLAGNGTERALKVGAVIAARTRSTVAVTAATAIPVTAPRPWPTRRSAPWPRPASTGSPASPPGPPAPSRC